MPHLLWICPTKKCIICEEKWNDLLISGWTTNREPWNIIAFLVLSNIPPRASITRKNNKGDKGLPCRSPLELWKKPHMLPFTSKYMSKSTYSIYRTKPTSSHRKTIHFFGRIFPFSSSCAYVIVHLFEWWYFPIAFFILYLKDDISLVYAAYAVNSGSFMFRYMKITYALKPFR